MSPGSQAARFAVGIDLGTTNCTLAYAPLDDEEAAPQVLAVPQLVASGEVASDGLLPSFVYLPVEGEEAQGALALPWSDAPQPVVGRHARERALQVPGRVVSSAKSWLCHGGVDRRGALLPWGAADDVPRMSPVEASARYLQHLRQAWDQAHPEAPLAAQDLVVTVPASFDAVARALTQEAAQQAGLGDRLTLLEEPQAAFYAWLAAQGAAWREQVQVGDRILVCDVGGGTTDFSLIAVDDEGGGLALSRVAVGEHILLGGDNMDLALAHALREKLGRDGRSVDDWQLVAMTHGCRLAKETLLREPERAGYPVVVPSRGRRLLGGTLSAELDRGELDAILLEGFFPAVAREDRPQQARRSALTTLGLPYAADAAITRHLAAFLARAQQAVDGEGAVQPGAVLFNGGVFNALPLRARVLEALVRWQDGAAVRELPGADPDLAVARGAAFYGRVRQGRGLRIKSGTARSYYVGIERAGLAVPGVAPRVDAVCVAPYGMEEGSEVELAEELGLWVGEPTSFRFFASAARQDDAVASRVDPAAASLEELPPIETRLDGEPGLAVPVRLRARVTEVGTLELAAVEVQGGRRHRLEFNIRVQ